MHRATDVEKSITRVRFTGVWTMDEFESNKAMLTELERAAPARVEFDLTNVPAIDSAGIGMLILANDRFSKAGIAFQITGATGAVAQIFDVAKIRDLITII